jgi:predicted HTH transcriptional regulator
MAKTCVYLANTQGGYLFLGIEDKEKLFCLGKLDRILKKRCIGEMLNGNYNT